MAPIDYRASSTFLYEGSGRTGRKLRSQEGTWNFNYIRPFLWDSSSIKEGSLIIPLSHTYIREDAAGEA